MWILKAKLHASVWGYDLYWTGSRATMDKRMAKKYITETGAQAVADKINGENGGVKYCKDQTDYTVEFKVEKDEQ